MALKQQMPLQDIRAQLTDSWVMQKQSKRAGRTCVHLRCWGCRVLTARKLMAAKQPAAAASRRFAPLLYEWSELWTRSLVFPVPALSPQPLALLPGLDLP